MTQSNEEFLPSAKPAKYSAEYVPHETNGPLLIEDDQMYTEWYNPTSTDVVLEIYVGTDPKNHLWRKAFLEASQVKRLEMKSGNKIFIVKAGQTREIPAEYDLAIQRTHCLHPQCTAKKDACKDLDHPRVVASGLAPQLVCKKWRRVPSLAANLDMARAQAEQALKQLAESNADKMNAELSAAQAYKLLEEAQKAAREAKEAQARAEEIAARETKARLDAENKLQQSAEASKKQQQKGQ